MKRNYEELRRLTVEAAAKGRKATEIAEFCGVTLRTIHRWLKDFRNGRTGPPQRKHKPYAIDPQTAAKIAERIEKQPGITLAELKSDLQLDCTLSTIHNTLKRMGYSYKKKTLHASEQRRKDVTKKRKSWHSMQARADMGRFVFVDESAAATSMIRRHGRAMKGKRCVDHAPGSWKTITMLASLRPSGETTCAVIEGATTGAVFLEYVRKFLAPTLRKGDIVVLDNLSSHKNSAAAKIVKEKKARLAFLPPYSPDLNPIEKMWSKIKSWLRRVAARDLETVCEAVGQAFSLVTVKDALGWTISSGYRS